MHHIFVMGEHANFKLGIWMEYDNPHHRLAQRPQRSRL